MHVTRVTWVRSPTSVSCNLVLYIYIYIHLFNFLLSLHEPMLTCSWSDQFSYEQCLRGNGFQVTTWFSIWGCILKGQNRVWRASISFIYDIECNKQIRTLCIIEYSNKQHLFFRLAKNKMNKSERKMLHASAPLIYPRHRFVANFFKCASRNSLKRTRVEVIWSIKLCELRTP